MLHPWMGVDRDQTREWAETSLHGAEAPTTARNISVTAETDHTTNFLFWLIFFAVSEKVLFKRMA